MTRVSVDVPLVLGVNALTTRPGINRKRTDGFKYRGAWCLKYGSRFVGNSASFEIMLRGPAETGGYESAIHIAPKVFSNSTHDLAIILSARKLSPDAFRPSREMLRRHFYEIPLPRVNFSLMRPDASRFRPD